MGRDITVSGFDWCNNETQNIDIELLTSKILCTHHNNTLTNIDKAAARLFEIFRETSELVNTRTKYPHQIYKHITYDVNAKKLEQWFLKTLINLCFDQALYIGLSSTRIGYPSEELVKICYENEKFSGKAGMYLSAAVGMNFNSTDEVIFTPLIKDNKYVVGGFFLFRGLSFYLCINSDGAEFPLSQFQDLPASWCHGELSRPFKKLDIRVNNKPSHRIRFNWQ
jgi:hypothetical protein